MDITGKTFLITGGASGLGEATARQLHSLGANVSLGDLNQDRGESLVSEFGERACFFKVDVADEDSTKTWMEGTAQKFGKLHGLINCAGVGTPGKLVDKEGSALPLANYAKVIQINLIGTFNTARLFAERVLKDGINPGEENGVIINTASVAAFDGQIGQIAYSSSKGGVVGMTLPMARELARHGIRVMTIAPGIFETPMLMGLPEAARESLGKQIPFPSRLGKPAEYAQLCQAIIENPMLNGETIRLDGSIRMAPK